MVIKCQNCNAPITVDEIRAGSCKFCGVPVGQRAATDKAPPSGAIITEYRGAEITVRENSEEAAQESLERAKALYDRLNDGSLIMNGLF